MFSLVPATFLKFPLAFRGTHVPLPAGPENSSSADVPPFAGAREYTNSPTRLGEVKER